MAKFKKGDRVMRTISDYENNVPVGTLGTVTKDCDGSPRIKWDVINDEGFYDEDRVEIISSQKTWETLEVGDVLVDESLIEEGYECSEHRIIAVTGELIAFEVGDTWAWNSIKCLKDLKYKIKGASEEVTEMTHEEVEEELGKKIKIITK